HRERFAAQVARLDAEPDLDVVGSRLRLFPSGAYGEGMRRWRNWHDSLLTHEDIRRELLIDSPVAHGCVMLRREAVERVGGWHEHGWAEDLDLWIRLAESGARFGKLARVLYAWRQHERSSTRQDARYAHERFTALKVAALDRGVLSGGRRALLVGTGTSLGRWAEALGPRVERTVEVKQPPVGARAGEPLGVETREPHVLVLVLMAPAARARWRRYLTDRGHTEMQDFIFVA
ncbi:MAG: glycosyl transferase, partial [Candidatus Eisenbacteria bacterium]|nr:glycosyl transferase [Candidatus Eisenbacteria bacterium]